MADDGLFKTIHTLGNLPPLTADADNNSLESNPNNTDGDTGNLKINAALLFARTWNQAQAAQRRNDLTAQLPNNEPVIPNTRDPILQPQTEQANDLLKQSWQDLVSLASQHKDLESFHNASTEFWDKVVAMSELRTTETYINGRLEPRAASRYGKLLEMLNRQGGAAHLENFLNNLPPGEKEVFLARYQINQTFGANELFAGRGIATDIKGQFPLNVFLSANGKNPQLSAGLILGLSGGDAPAFGRDEAFHEQNIFTANFHFLLNSKSAALLGLSLALHQNINALLSISELTPEAFLPKAALESAALPNHTNNRETFGKSETISAADAKRFADGALVAGALISGALKTAEKYRKNKSSVGAPRGFDNAAINFSFAAGATGALMGATVGCVVPLAEKSVGEILGFATSVVVGLTDAGLRSLGANTLISLISSGVQSFLDGSVGNQKSLPNGAPEKFLNDAKTLENHLRKHIDNRPLIISG